LSAPSLRALYLSRVEGGSSENCAPRIARRELRGRESRARGARLEAHDELVPEAGVRPVLDGERGADRDVRVLRAVDLVELVAEVERRRGAVAALAAQWTASRLDFVRAGTLAWLLRLLSVLLAVDSGRRALQLAMQWG